MIVLSYTADLVYGTSGVKNGGTITVQHEGRKARGIEDAMRYKRLSSREAEFYHREDM